MKLTQRILQLADGKRDLADVALEVGTTERYVRQFLSRSRRYDLIPSTPEHDSTRKSPWHSAIDERLKELYATGISNREISQKLNRQFDTSFSRSAVRGRAARLGVVRHKKANKTKEQVVVARPRRTPNRVCSPISKVVQYIPPPRAAHLIARKTLAELQEWDCHFPVGDPQQKDFGFCGQERVPGKPYCLDCCQRAYISVSLPARREKVEA